MQKVTRLVPDRRATAGMNPSPIQLIDDDGEVGELRDAPGGCIEILGECLSQQCHQRRFRARERHQLRGVETDGSESRSLLAQRRQVGAVRLLQLLSPWAPPHWAATCGAASPKRLRMRRKLVRRDAPTAYHDAAVGAGDVLQLRDPGIRDFTGALARPVACIDRRRG